MKKSFVIFKILLVLAAVVFIAPGIASASSSINLSVTGNEGYVYLEWSTVDAQVYDASAYKIYRGDTSDFTPDNSSLLTEVSAQARNYYDYSVAPEHNYYYIVSAVDAAYGVLATSNSASSSADAKQPHGYYDNKTTKCGICHSSHEAKGAELINTDVKTAEDLCKICHEDGGESKLIVEKAMAGSSTTNCTSCHNPHGNNKNQKFVPMLLQVTLDGKVLFQSENPELGVGNGFCLTSECHADYKDFKYDPPVKGEAHDSLDKMVAAQGLPTTTGISCNGCHQKHGSDAQKLLRKEIKANDTTYAFTNDSGLYEIFNGSDPIVDTYNAFCESCHENKLRGWSGTTNYNSTNNVHNNVACYGCHDPHGQGKDKYLRDDFAFSAPSSGTIAENFKLCFNCHKTSVLTGQDTITTKFSSVNGGQSVNLHVYHLEYGKTIGDSSKNAICLDCHGPHGPAVAKNISFPSQYQSTYLKAYEGAKPEFNFTASGTGSCNLICHGIKHTEVNASYEATSGTQTTIITEPVPTPSTPTDSGTGSSVVNDGYPTEQAPQNGGSTPDTSSSVYSSSY